MGKSLKHMGTGKFPLRPCVWDSSPLSYISFSVSGFMWRSLIHLDLSFVQGDKKASICILLHDNLQLNQHHLLKMLSFFSVDGFSSFVKDQVTTGMWVHFWVFNPIPLIYLPVIVTVPCSFYPNCSVVQLEVWDGDSARSSFTVENSFCYPMFFCYYRWICKFLLLIRWRIELEFWWGLHWICRLLLAR